MKSYKAHLLLSIFSCIILLNACKKENTINTSPQETLNLPDTLSIVYGNDTSINLKSSISEHITLSFEENENTTILPGKTTNDIIAQGVSIHNDSVIKIETNALYPNGAENINTKQTVPKYYQIRVTKKDANDHAIGTQVIYLKVVSANIQIENIQQDKGIAYTYILYGTEKPTLNLLFNSSIHNELNWYLQATNDLANKISISNSTLVFSEDLGDPAKKEERQYNIIPSILKDGYIVAQTPLKVIFIPKIKFFFGTYYPEYDLTILTNLIHIGLSNGYVSAAPTLYPSNYASTYSIVSIQKDKANFEDKDNLFSINANSGVIQLKSNATLSAGNYEITINAVTTLGLVFETNLTLAMEKLE